MKTSLFTSTAVMTLCLLTADLSAKETEPVYSGINKVEFPNSQYNKNFVGNGFLIKHEDKQYAVTVKHTLLEAKTPELKSVDIAPHVSRWLIHPNHKPEQYIKLGKLLNKNKQEKIDMNILSKDWLVFEVAENKSPLKALTLRDTPLQEGEKLTAFGCSYATQKDCTQDQYTGEFLAFEGNNLRVKLENFEPGKLRGLSGSPVLDSNGKLVGIVSNVLRSVDGEGFDFAPASLDYLNKVLESLN